MADETQLARLKAGVDDWNAWREANSELAIDLERTNLSRANLSRANLSGAKLSGADWLPTIS